MLSRTEKPRILTKGPIFGKKKPRSYLGGMLRYKLKITLGQQQIGVFFEIPKYMFP